MAEKGKLQTRLEYLLAVAVIGTLQSLPRKAALRVAIALGRSIRFILRSQWRTAIRNLEMAMPDLPDSERRRIAKGTFENLGRTLGYVSESLKLRPESLVELIEIDLGDAEESFERVRSEGRGVMFVTAHIGNWELVVMAFAVQKEPISFLARPLDNLLLEEAATQIRSRYGNRPINKTNSVMAAIRVLRKGGILGVLADVNAHPKEGVFVPFFGIPACTASGAAAIAIRANAAIFPAFSVWDGSIGKYRFVCGELIEPQNTGDRDRDIVETTAAYTAAIEKVVRAYPDQWMWIHKRWKTRPPGEPELY